MTQADDSMLRLCIEKTKKVSAPNIYTHFVRVFFLHTSRRTHLTLAQLELELPGVERLPAGERASVLHDHLLAARW